MKNIKAYVERQNQWNALFNGRKYDLNNPKDRQSIADKIDSDLSPENLTCDGELSRGQVNTRYRQLTAAARELKALDPTVVFYEYA